MLEISSEDLLPIISRDSQFRFLAAETGFSAGVEPFKSVEVFGVVAFDTI